MLGHVGTSRLIGSGPIRPPVRPSKGQSDVLQAIDHSVAGSMTAQPPGIRPSALRVTTHGQQVASLEGVLPLCRGAVGVFYSPSRQGEVIDRVLGAQSEFSIGMQVYILMKIHWLLCISFEMER